jgi:hypothetical protein
MEILNAPSTDINSGLVIDGRPVQPPVELVPSQSRVDHWAKKAMDRSHGESDEDIRRSVSDAGATDVASGLTSDGRPSTIGHVTGADERYKREQEEKLARDRAAFGGRLGS